MGTIEVWRDPRLNEVIHQVPTALGCEFDIDGLDIIFYYQKGSYSTVPVVGIEVRPGVNVISFDFISADLRNGLSQIQAADDLFFQYDKGFICGLDLMHINTHFSRTELNALSGLSKRNSQRYLLI